MKTYRVSAICHKSIDVEAKNLKEATKLGRETLGRMAAFNNIMILEITPLEQQVINTVVTNNEVTIPAVAAAVVAPSEPTINEPVNSEPVANESSPVITETEAKVQVLTCAKCEKTWERPAQRGRKPITCPDC